MPTHQPAYKGFASKDRLIAFVAAITLQAGATAAGADYPRCAEVEDLLTSQDLPTGYGGPTDISSGSDRVAISIIRPIAGEKHTSQIYGRVDAADIWVSDTRTAKLENITHGSSDGTGWWAPSWSPDGRYLAMLSTRGPRVGTWLWLWDSRTSRLRRMLDRQVDTDMMLRRPFTWISPTAIVTLEEAPDKYSLVIGATLENSAVLAPPAWQAAYKGDTPSVSVLKSPLDLRRAWDARLVRVNIAGAVQVITEGVVTFRSGNNVVALLESRAAEPLPPADRANRYNVPLSLVLWNAHGGRISVPTGIVGNILERSVEWSPNHESVAFLTYENGAHSANLYVVDVSGQHAERLVVPNVDVSSVSGFDPPSILHWLGDGWVIRGTGNTATVGAITNSRAEWSTGGRRVDWWFVNRVGVTKNVTAGMPSVPDNLWLDASDKWTMYAVLDSTIYRIDPRRADVPIIANDVVRMIAPEPEERGLLSTVTVASSRFIFIDRNNQTVDLDPQSGVRRSLDVSRRIPKFLNRSTSGSIWVLVNDRSGLDIVQFDNVGHQRSVFSANSSLSNVVEANVSGVSYRDSAGVLRGAVLVSPCGRQATPNPLIVLVYPGQVFPPDIGTRPSGLRRFRLPMSSYLSPQIAAARGFYVLLPSMPDSDDPFITLDSGVSPAINKVLESGEIDRDRVYLMGHSFGGFGVMGLLAQTNRYAAAVEMAGPSNFVSQYGTFDGRSRYLDEFQLGQQLQMEIGQFHGKVPLYENLWKYARNSPINYVDRIQTPLMLIQGDLDYVPITQGEELFVSLARQGKEAEFVRYWGEDHVLRSPANIMDMWRRVFKFFDDHGRKQGRGNVLP